jgi:hypothetical protein
MILSINLKILMLILTIKNKINIKRILFMTVMLLAAITVTLAQDYKYEQDYLDKDKVNIKDYYGNLVGYYKLDYFDKSKINVYDKYGNLVQTVKNDYFDKKQNNYYDSYGNKQKSTK